MTFRNLFGEKVSSKTIKLSVFHDEREIPKKWLYHGFLFVQQERINSFVDTLKKIREDFKWDRELKFVNLKNTKTQNLLAEKYVEAFITSLLNNEVFYYFFGIDYKNLEKRLWENPETRDFKIYNRFFQIGLYGALSWFLKKDFDIIEVHKVFSDKRSRKSIDPFHIQPIREIKFKTFAKEENIIFSNNSIIEVDSDHNKENKYPDYSHLIQLVDLLTGGFSQIFDFTSKHEGKWKIADILINNGLPQEIMGYKSHNFESKYYKRCCVSFFPKEKHNKKEILNGDIKSKINKFYNERKLKYPMKNQLKLNI